MSMLPYEPSPFTSEGKAYIELQQRCRELQAEIDGLRAAHEPPALHREQIKAICHALTDNCVMVDDPERPPCCFDNCAAMKAAARASQPPPAALQPILDDEGKPTGYHRDASGEVVTLADEWDEDGDGVSQPPVVLTLERVREVLVSTLDGHPHTVNAIMEELEDG